MNAYIVSLKFSPGLLKEFMILGENLKSKGYNIIYLLANDYKRMINDYENKYFIIQSSNSKEMIKDSIVSYKLKRKIKEIMSNNKPDFICIYNPHPLNYIPLKLAKNESGNCIRSIYLHEPYKQHKEKFSYMERVYRNIIEITQSMCYRYMTDAIFPSEYAEKMYIYKYENKYYVNKHVAPLLLSKVTKVPSNNKKYFSIVGNIDSNRSLDEFIDLIKYVDDVNDNSFKFKIITRSNIDIDLCKLTDKQRSRVEIINKNFITDDEISQVLDESFATLLPHKQITQSGNVPTAFRWGTPVIARNIEGFAQHIDNKKNGILLEETFRVEELYKGVKYIQSNINKMSYNCLETFDNYFSEDNWHKYYSWLS